METDWVQRHLISKVVAAASYMVLRPMYVGGALDVFPIHIIIQYSITVPAL